MVGDPIEHSALASRLLPGERPTQALVLHHGEVLVTDRRVLTVGYPRIFFSLIKTGRIDHTQRIGSVEHIAYGVNNNVVGMVFGALCILVGLVEVVATRGISIIAIAFGAAVIWEAIKTELVIGDRTSRHLALHVRPNERMRTAQFMFAMERVLADPS